MEELLKTKKQGYKQSKIGLIPDDWEVVKLSETRIRQMKGFHRHYNKYYMNNYLSQENQIREISVIKTNP